MLISAKTKFSTAVGQLRIDTCETGWSPTQYQSHDAQSLSQVLVLTGNSGR
jgi:hypothetical protein